MTKKGNQGKIVAAAIGGIGLLVLLGAATSKAHEEPPFGGDGDGDGDGDDDFWDGGGGGGGGSGDTDIGTGNIFRNQRAIFNAAGYNVAINDTPLRSTTATAADKAQVQQFQRDYNTIKDFIASGTWANPPAGSVATARTIIMPQLGAINQQGKISPVDGGAATNSSTNTNTNNALMATYTIMGPLRPHLSAVRSAISSGAQGGGSSTDTSGGGSSAAINWGSIPTVSNSSSILNTSMQYARALRLLGYTSSEPASSAAATSVLNSNAAAFVRHYNCISQARAIGEITSGPLRFITGRLTSNNVNASFRNALLTAVRRQNSSFSVTQINNYVKDGYAYVPGIPLPPGTNPDEYLTSTQINLAGITPIWPNSGAAWCVTLGV